MNKRIIITAMAAVMLAVSANAQTRPVQFSAIADVSVNALDLSSFSSVSETKAGVGFDVGGSFNFNLCRGFSIQPELLLNYSSYKADSGNTSEFLQTFGLQVPVYFLGEWKVGDGHMYAGAGPYGDYTFSGRYDGTNVMKRNDTPFRLNPCHLGGAVKIGWEFACGFQVNLSGKYSFTSCDKGDGTMTRYNVALGVGYNF